MTTSYHFWLLKVNATDGDHHFILGADGVFTDSTGQKWWGSTALKMSKAQVSINGTAPAATVSFSYFQDSDNDDLIAQLKALGPSYLLGRSVGIYLQTFASQEEMMAPTSAPVLMFTYTIGGIRTSIKGGQDRSIELQLEGAFENRKDAKRFVLNETGHSEMLGSTNPSLEFMPGRNDPQRAYFL